MTRLFLILSIIYSVVILAHQDSPLKSKTFQNGFSVYVYEKKTAPIAAVQLWYKVASVHEQVNQRGIAHFFEHMMFRGSKHVGDEEHSQLIEEVGGNSNAYTADDMTVYIQTLPANHVELAIKLEAERMQNLIIDQARLAKEVEVVKEEYRWRYQNNPYGDVFKQTRSVLFLPDHYGVGPIGILDDLTKMSVADAEAFYKTYYSVNNAFLVIVGDVDAEDIFNLAQHYFGSMKGIEIPQKEEFKPKRHKKRVYNLHSQLALPLTLVGYYIPEAKHKDQYALKLLFNILSKGNSSRLYKELVQNKRLVSYIYGLNFGLKESGFLGFPAVHENDHVVVEKQILNQLRQIKRFGVTADELNKVKNQLVSSEVISKYSVNNLASQIGRSIIYKENVSFFDHDLKEYIRVTNDDVIRVANTYFTNDNKVSIRFDPKKDEK